MIGHIFCKFLHNRRISYFNIYQNVNQSLGDRGSTIPEMSEKELIIPHDNEAAIRPTSCN